jgi:Pyridine nucleotide-disulphide oxidoreductase
MKPCDVVIIGAGPYGLSIAAHLRAANVDFRIFGTPMHTWTEHMPRGMRLKSDGFASSLYEPDSRFTLESYCKANGLPYADLGLPVPLETFTAYGLEFQKRFVPQLEDKSVVSLKQCNEGYQLSLKSGEIIAARRVVVAAGLSYYEYVPPILSSLPETHLSHSSKNKTLDHFSGRDIIVVGAGASALDTAALLHQAGARVRVVARTPQIRMWDPPAPAPKSFLAWIQNPISGLGRGWRLYLCASAPLIFRLMPQKFRLDKVKHILGPNPAWFIKKDIEGKVSLHPGFEIADARIENGRVKLQVTDRAGASQTFDADHVISATGYRVDLRRLPFFDENLLSQIQTVEQTPILSSNFESSLSGLYFVGASAANTFGPLLRFAVGAKFTARHLSKHLARVTAHNRVPAGTKQESLTNPDAMQEPARLGRSNTAAITRVENTH